MKHFAQILPGRAATDCTAAFQYGCALLALLGTAWPAMSAPDFKPEAQVSQIKVQPDKAPDCTTLKSIVETVTRDCRSNDEKAIALYNFMQLTHYHRNYPSEPGGIPVLKEINTYGWSLCGGLHSEQSALWRELGWGWRFVGWNGHTTVEAQYDNQWHYLDVFLKFYAWKPDPNAPGGRTIASQDDLTRDSQRLISDAFVLDKSRGAVYAKDNQFEMHGDKANWMAPAFLSCGDTIKDVISGLKTHKNVGPEPGWMGIHHATGNYSADVNLAPGFALTSSWDSVEDGWHWPGSKIAPQHTCGNKDLRNSPDAGLVLEPYAQRVRSYADGSLRFAPDFGSDAFLKSFVARSNVKYVNGSLVPEKTDAPASVTVLLRSPYLMTKATGAAAGAESLEISTDGGETFKTADLADFTGAVKGQVAALARINFKSTLKSLKLEAVVQNNPGSLAYLSPGKNVIAVSVTDPGALGDNRLVVTYAYEPGFRSKSLDQLGLEGKEVARQHHATWAKEPVVVQKVFAAKDLPAKFEIDVPTPKDKFPVYPRMKFVRREIVAPGSKPLPLPENARTDAAAGPNDELKTLPNPFLIGTQPPPKRAGRAVKTTMLELQPGHFVSKTAGVLTSEANVAWHKDLCGRLRALDPFKHLITSSWRDAGMFALPEIDLVQAHQYWPIEMDAAQYSVQNSDHLMRPFGKPFFFGEQGMNDHFELDPDGKTFHDALWSSSLSGAAGTGLYWHWNTHIEKYDLYKHYRPLAKFLRPADWPSSEWKTMKTTRPNLPVSLNIYGLAAPDRALVWIHDPLAFRVVKDKSARGPAQPEASVNVAGLEPGNYKIEFFSTATSEVVGSDSQPVRPLRHFGYGIELKPPPFWGDIAARIIRQGQQWKKE